MEVSEIVAVAVAALASPWLGKLIESGVNKLLHRKSEIKKIDEKIDEVKSSTKELKDELDKVKFDQMRTNLMILIKDYPKSPDIPELSRRYIVDFNGDSYMVPLIDDWFTERNLDKPEWLIDATNKHKR